MKQLSAVLAIIALSIGCSRETNMPSPDPLPQSAAVDSLNEQIEKFNEDRPGNMGVSPIDSRVARIEYDAKLDQLACFDKDGEQFLVLKREPDGRYKGTIEVEFHELVGTGPDDSHSWGTVTAEFYLEEGVF